MLEDPTVLVVMVREFAVVGPLVVIVEALIDSKVVEVVTRIVVEVIDLNSKVLMAPCLFPLVVVVVDAVVVVALVLLLVVELEVVSVSVSWRV